MTLAPAQNMMVEGDVTGGILGCKLTCQNCIFFRSRAVFKSPESGTPMPCSSPGIGRAATAKPCMEFKPSSMELFADTPKKELRLLLKTLGKMRTTNRFKNRNSAWIQAVIAFFGAYQYSIDKSIPLGARVRVEGSDTSGILLFLDRDAAIVLTDDDVRTTIPDIKLIKLDVEFATADQQDQETAKKPRKKAATKKPKTAVKSSKTVPKMGQPTKATTASPKKAAPKPKAKPKTKPAAKAKPQAKAPVSKKPVAAKAPLPKATTRTKAAIKKAT